MVFDLTTSSGAMRRENPRTESLDQALRRTGSAVELLRNASVSAVPFNGVPEYTNWRSEQKAWRESVALLDQSHHMNDLFVSGTDALRLFSELGANSFDGFQVGKAKQLITVTNEGYFIGDNILFYLDEYEFDLVGQPFSIDWIQYNATSGDYDVEIHRDPPSTHRGDRPPELFRFELQGPNALALVNRLTDGTLPKIKFFNMAELSIADVPVRALRHGMAAQPGFELFGAWEHGDKVINAILDAGGEFDLYQVGTKAYSTANLESGWIPALVPGFYTNEDLSSFRKWLPVSAIGSLGGSYYSRDITDYYVTPYDLGYGKLVGFNHEFLGRDALQELSTQPSREKVSLVWNETDVERAIGSSLSAGTPRTKYMELPKARYATHQYDMVLVDDELVGFSSDCGYIENERCFVSLATVDGHVAQAGTEVVVVWGEEPNSLKPGVEPHRQIEIRATVAPAPLTSFARTTYRSA